MVGNLQHWAHVSFFFAGVGMGDSFETLIQAEETYLLYYLNYLFVFIFKDYYLFVMMLQTF